MNSIQISLYQIGVDNILNGFSKMRGHLEKGKKKKDYQIRKRAGRWS